MARSIQVYEFYISKTTDVITEKLRQLKQSSTESNPLQTMQVGEANDVVMVSIKARVGRETLWYDITILPARNRLIVQGSRVGRDRINAFLAEAIEKKSRESVIKPYRLDVEDSLRIFRNITNEHRSNFMKYARVQFEPKVGYEYGDEIYQEIGFKFVEGRCVSTHKDFEAITSNGKRMYMTMLLNQCAGLKPEGGKDLQMVVSPDCSFRLYVDRPQPAWNEFCEKVVPGP